MLSKKSYQKGFTLIELLVGLAIGLLVGFVSLNYLATSTRLLVNQNASDLIQENTRFAFDFLSSEVRLAGLNEATEVDKQNSEGFQVVEGISTENICMADANDVPVDGETGPCNIDGETYTLGPVEIGGTPGLSINSDRIAIDYVTRDGTTCSGEIITQESSVITVYWVADIDQDSIPSLYCQSYVATFSLDPAVRDYDDYRISGTLTPLVDGVESLQVLYGVDADADDVDGAGNPTGDEGIESYDIYTTGIGVENIRSVKIGLLVSSGQVIQRQQNSERAGIDRTYSVLGQDFTVLAADRIERKSLATTIHFQNLSPATL